MPHHEKRREGVRVDYLGGALCVVGLGTLVFGFIEQPRLGWSATIIGTLLGGAAALVAFVVWERKESQPMLPLRLFRLRNFSVSNIETFAVYGGLSAFSFFLVVFLQQLAGYSPFRAGLTTLPVTLVMFSLSRYAGAFRDEVRAALAHDARADHRRPLDDRFHAAADARELLARPPAAAPRLRRRPLLDGGAADDDRALGCRPR